MRFVVLAALVAVIAWVNVDYYLRRRRMSPAERAADDEELRRELSIW